MLRQKILFICRGDLTSNASTLRALGLGNELYQQNYDVTIILPRNRLNQQLKLETKNIKIHLSKSGILELFSKVYFIHFNHDYDIVHSINIGTNSFFIALICKLYNKNIKLVTDIDEWNSKLFKGRIKRIYIEWLERIAINKSDILIFASKHLQEIFTPKNRMNSYYIPYAVDIEYFNEMSKDFDENSKNSLCNVVYMGSFQIYFGLEILIDAAEEIINKIPNVKFIMIGDGPARMDIEIVVKKRYPNYFSFHGYLPNQKAYKYLRTADVLLLPLKDSTINRSRCPNKLFLYLAAQKPIVTTAVGEVHNIMEKDAFYYEDGNIHSFAEAVYDAYKKPKINSKERLNQNTWKSRTLQYIKILEQHEL